MPQTNREYWKKKIARNKERDRQVTQELEGKGWNVIRIWEYDIKHDFEHCIKVILSAINREYATS